MSPYRGTLFRLALTNVTLLGAVAGVYSYLDTARGAGLRRATTGDSGIFETDAGLERVERGRLSAFDQQFLSRAAEISGDEIHVGVFAQRQAEGGALRDLAHDVVVHHRAARREVEALAARKGVLLPAGESKSEGADRVLSRGAGFDHAFVEWAVTSQGAALKLFQSAAEGCEDPELRVFAARMLPLVKTQHERARRLNRAIF